MATKLTQFAVENEKPRAKRFEKPDGLLAGLYLVVQPLPSGAKSWAVRTRVAGKPVKITLGAYPTIPLAKARELGREMLLQVKRGINPLEEKRERQRAAERAAGNSLKAVCEGFMAREGKRLRTVDQRRATFERLVYPALGNLPIEGIRRGDLVRLLDGIEDRNGPRMADLVLAYLRRIFNWHAARTDDFRSPVVRGMSRHEAKARERILTDDELRSVWESAGDGSAFGAFVRFLLLTGARRNEAARMTWREIVGTDWTLPSSRNKTKVDLVRPLPKAARDLLAAVPRFQACDWVFSATGRRPLAAFGKLKARFDEACGVGGWTLHDLRRTARSLMSRAGVPSDHAERCLGHVVGGVRGVYDRHQFHAEKAQAFEALAAQIERIVNPTDNVVEMRRGG